MRNPGLDLLRFIAVFLVIGHHLYRFPEQTNHFCYEIIKVWQCGGWIGVELFFVLSGFLISSLLFKEAQANGNIDAKTFLIRRGLKIYPAFWFMLGITLIARIFFSGPIPIRQLIGELTFTQNYLGGLWLHTWSLAVEEHFYFGIALVLCLVTRYRPEKNDHFQWIPVAFIVIAVMCLSLRLLTSYLIQYTHNFYFYLYGTHVKIDSLMFGVLLSWLWHYRDLSNKIKKFPSWFFVALGVVFLSPGFYFGFDTWWIQVFGVVLFYLGSGALLLGFLQFNSSRHKLLKGLAILGACSYSIYLWHMPVNALVTWVLSKLPGGNPYILYLFFYVVGAFIIGTFLSKLIEYPILKLRDQLFPSKSLPLNAGIILGASSGLNPGWEAAIPFIDRDDPGCGIISDQDSLRIPRKN